MQPATETESLIQVSWQLHWGRFQRYMARNYPLYVMIAVPLAICLLFKYFPMYGMVVAFKKYSLTRGFQGTEWVGLRYIIQFLEDPYFPRLIRNTFRIGLVTLLFNLPAPIILALALNEVISGKVRRTVQTITYFPYFVSSVIVIGIMLQFIYSEGLVNRLLAGVGIEPIAFLNEPGWFVPLYVLTEMWQKTGYWAIIYLAALSAIDSQLYEAAIVDGAHRGQQMWHVTLPGIVPTIAVVLILSVGRVMKVSLDKILLMYNPAIYETADVLQTYVYRRGILGSDFSYAAAVGLFNSVIGLVLVILANRISRRVSEQSVW